MGEVFVFMMRRVLKNLTDLARRIVDALIRVFDQAGNVIETHERAGEFKEP